MNMNNQINNQKEIKNTNVKTLSIIINGEIRNVVLDDFKKEKITFGRDPTNDIVLSSHFVSKFHGYFELKNNELIIVDNESKNGLIINSLFSFTISMFLFSLLCIFKNILEFGVLPIIFILVSSNLYFVHFLTILLNVTSINTPVTSLSLALSILI